MKDDLNVSDRTHTTDAATSTSYSRFTENPTPLQPSSAPPLTDATTATRTTTSSDTNNINNTSATFLPFYQHPTTKFSNNNRKKQYPPVEKEDDTYSISSRLSLNSTTDGVDVLVAHEAPSTFRAWSHLTAARVVCSILFKRTVLFLILVTSVLLGARTMDRVRGNAVALRAINGTLDGLVFVFTLEVFVSVACYLEQLLSTGWLVTDIAILALVGITGNKSILVLRSFRLIRALRKASGVPALKWAVKAILRVLPRLAAVVGVLLPGMFAIFAILFTNLYQDAELDDAESGEQLLTESYFSRLDVSALTLFQIMTGGREWAIVCAELQAQYPSAWVPLVSFVIISIFFFGGLIVAIMCDAVNSVNRDRMWKSLDPDHKTPSRTVASTDVGDLFWFGNEGYAIPHDCGEKKVSKLENETAQRLEKKLETLTRNVEQLLRVQASLQESVQDFCEREKSRHLPPMPSNRSSRQALTMMTIPDIAKAQSDDI